MNNYEWRTDTFDSEIFGFSVAKIDSLHQHFDVRDLTQLIDEFTEKNIRYAVYRTLASNYRIIHLLEQNGFVTVDGLLSLNSDISRIDTTPDPDIRAATQEDISELRRIASTAFSVNRVYNDPILDKSKANEMYARWVENSVRKMAADETLIKKVGDHIAGFVTLQKKGHIPLIAVAEPYRGKGIARSLVHAAHQHMHSWGLTVSEIETQTINIPAIRSYQAAGYKIQQAFTTFRWSNV